MTYAEHTKANLPSCNAAARLQARAESNQMSPLTEFDQRMEQIIREFALRIIVPRWTEFDDLWEAAIRVCDRYDLGKPKTAIQPGNSQPEQLALPMPEQTIPSSADCIDTRFE